MSQLKALTDKEKITFHLKMAIDCMYKGHFSNAHKHILVIIKNYGESTKSVDEALSKNIEK